MHSVHTVIDVLVCVCVFVCCTYGKEISTGSALHSKQPLPDVADDRQQTKRKKEKEKKPENILKTCRWSVAQTVCELSLHTMFLQSNELCDFCAPDRYNIG